MAERRDGSRPRLLLGVDLLHALVTFTYTSFFFSSVWNLLGSSDDKAAAFGDAGMVTLKRLKICLRPLPHQVFT